MQSAVAIIGAATLLIAGFSALAQRDIKRVLAYSTISQLGYMFLALGVGAWSAAIFHLMTHAFFKALLFLGAGVVILAQRHEQDMFKMGGLKDKLPVTFWTFLIGSASLSALPLVTAGFYSKDLILWKEWSSGSGGAVLLAAGLFGALITSIYTFRMVFLTFFGASKTEVSHKPGPRILTPLIILAILSIVGGFVNLPETFGSKPWLSDFLQNVLNENKLEPVGYDEGMLQYIASLVSIAGIFIAWLFFVGRPPYADLIGHGRVFESIRKFWLAGWDFDAMYDRLFVRPFMWLVRINKQDFIDSGYTGIAALNRMLSILLCKTQTGNIRWYAMGMVVGAVVFLGIVLLYQ